MATKQTRPSAKRLTEYQRKRDFGKTPEPAPRARARPHPRPRGRLAARRAKQPIFVVQEHHARRLHYDFRLEADGVLKSWAVPKEPTLDPAVKRLAVQTEDHPLHYATFHGDIPEGEYGAGHVEIWDHGTYRNLLADKPRPLDMAQAIEQGHVEVELVGQRLRGAFALVRLPRRGSQKKDNWLLIKMKDSHARAGTSDGNGRSTPRRRTVAPAPRRRARPPQAVEFTHVDRVVFPEAGCTKGDVLRFYQRIAPLLLPHLKDRPATLERLPEGLVPGGPRFWQKNTPAYYPAWVPRVELPSETGKSVNYALVNDEPTLLYLVNQGTITFHTWLSRVGSSDRPDFVLFDLDPGQASFADAVDVAKQLHARLEEQHCRACVKTSGKSGLHVLVPWRQQGDYADARAWAMELADQIAGEMSDTATTERSIAKRGRRVYVDVIQNARGHHVVPPYVLRAMPAATVSTPLRWEELTPQLDPTQFDLRTIFQRLGKQKLDPASCV